MAWLPWITTGVGMSLIAISAGFVAFSAKKPGGYWMDTGVAWFFSTMLYDVRRLRPSWITLVFRRRDDS